MGIAAFDPSPVIPDRRLVMATLADLVADLEGLTVDEIDGEFYWRCCRVDLSEPIVALRNAFPVPADSPGGPRTADDSRTRFAYLATAIRLAGFRIVDRFADAVGQTERFLEGVYPGPVFERLLAGNRVPMRTPQVALHYERGIGVSYRMSVYAGSWTGREVEHEFRRHAELLHGTVVAATTSAEPVPDSGPRVVHGSTSVTFSLVTDPADAFVAHGGVVRVPCIEIVAWPPLPDPGELARSYDRKMRTAEAGETPWHMALPGATARQDKEVALRTWVAGLLTAGQTRFGQAMREVAEATGTDEVSQARFTQNRAGLLERVPEAAAYLYARGKRGRPLS